MQLNASIVGPERPTDTSWSGSAFPPDLLDQVRGRLRLLAVLFFVAFIFDPFFYLVMWTQAQLAGNEIPADMQPTGWFPWMNLGAVVTSAGLWWVARRARVSPQRLVTLSLAYEIAICFVVGFTTFADLYKFTGVLPHMTWIPAVVIFFPLIMPGPPRRMLAGAIASGAMAPFSLMLLDLTGEVVVEDHGAYFNTSIHSAFAVLFAYMGARIIYGLREQVAAARELGAYRLEEKLGEGGMGEVWRASHRLLARPAAIKLIRGPRSKDGAAVAPAESVRRFEREAQAIARLRSPHTVSLFDFGVAADGAFYYAMELLDGLDAERFVERFGPLPAARAIFLLRQVCHSLSEAESLGLVHRDIKPANVFLCRNGEDCDFVKVLDFGLVKALDTAEDAGSKLSGEFTVGTPAFLAPEQARGEALDGRTDIYSTGLVAYWLLTGRLVFEASSPHAFLVAHAVTPPTAPSTVSELPIPEALDELVLACLAKDPAERPQSARELSQRLAAVEVDEVWTQERARAWWDQHLPVSARPS